jgi:phosphate-selective porin OprO and OprP
MNAILLSLLVIITASLNVQASELSGTWNNGFGFRSADGRNSLRIGAQTRIDWATFPHQDDAIADQQDGTEYRMARLYVSGLVYGNIAYKAQYEFASGGATMQSVYIELKKIPVLGNLRFGHTKEPLHMETITGTGTQPLMERSLASALAPSWNSGFLVHHSTANLRLGWQTGLFRDTNASGKGTGDDQYVGTGRLFGHIGDVKGTMVHLGAAYSYRNVDSVKYEQRPDMHLGDKLLSTKALPVGSVQLIGSEVLLRTGSLWMQAEAIASRLDTIGDPMMLGWYVQTGYVLTGERRGYKASSGTTSNIKPSEPFDGKGGIGAIEIVARVSLLDLDDASVAGGTMISGTLGVNWFPNPVTLLSINTSLSDLDGVGRVAGIQMRVQIAI